MPEEVWIATGKDTGFWLKILYENALLYCTRCQLHGHALSCCRKNKNCQEADQRLWAARGDLDPAFKPKDAASHAPQTKDKSLTKDNSNTRTSQSHPKPRTSHVLSFSPQTKDNFPSTKVKPILIKVVQPQAKGQQEKEWVLVQNRKKNKKAPSSQKDQRAKKGMDIVPQAMPRDDQDKVQPTAAIAGPSHCALSEAAPHLLATKSNTSSPNASNEPNTRTALPPSTTLGRAKELEAGNKNTQDNSTIQMQAMATHKGHTNDSLWVNDTVSTKYAFPPLTFLRRTANINKSSTPGASQKNLSITKSPRSACRRSPPAILLPRSYCLPTMDVQHPPSL